jgi:hypothetical protein
LKDYRGDGGLRTEFRDATGLPEAKATWRKRAAAWLHGRQGDSEEAARGKKRYRTKAAEWLWATDNALQAMTGHGWDQFVVRYLEPSETRPASSWPLLLVAPDQGSDGWAALNWLRSVSFATAEITLDPSHGVWNDVKLALKECGLWGHTLLMSIVLSMAYGPWCDARWFQEVIEGMDEYINIAEPETDVLFQQFLPSILGDTGSARHRFVDMLWWWLGICLSLPCSKLFLRTPTFL